MEEIYEVLQSIGSEGVVEKNPWSYKVGKEGSNLIFSFDSRPYLRKIRHHTSRLFYPLVDINMSKGDELIVGKDQWLEVLRDGSWARLTDADNR